MREPLYRLMHAGQWPQALACLDGLATPDADAGHASIERGFILTRLGLRRAAIRDYLHGLASDPENRTVLDATLSLALEEGDEALIKRLVAHVLSGRFAETSALLLVALRRLPPPFGVVQVRQGVVSGWALGQGKTLLIETGGQRIELPANLPSPQLQAAGLGDGANGFAFRLADASAGIRVGIEGVSLWGSPVDVNDVNDVDDVDPLIGRIGTASLRIAPSRARVSPPPAATPVPAANTPCVIVPVYGDAPSLRRCLDALATCVGLPANQVWIVEDCPADRDVSDAVRESCRQHGFHLLSRAFNAGFSAAVNSALRVVPAGDVILLNSDTVVAGDWVGRLQSAAYAAADIATVTPLSNHAELLSHPVPMRSSAFGSTPLAAMLDQLCRKARFKAVDVPTGVGFCLFIRADARLAAGDFDEVTFGRGYAEETDYCLRLSHAGWRHVGAPNVFVGHEGGHSFRAERALLAARNVQSIYARYPQHGETYDDWLAADPLATVRRELQRAAMPAVMKAAGVEELQLGARDDVLALLGQWQRAQGEHAMTFDDDGAFPAAYATCVGDKVRIKLLNLPLLDEVDYPHPSIKKTLLTALAAARVHSLVIQSLTPAILQFLEACPAAHSRVFHLEDAGGYCPRGSATVEGGQRCGGAQTDADCDACVSRLGTPHGPPVGAGSIEAAGASTSPSGTAQWRQRVRRQLAKARRIVVDDRALGQAYQAHFPELSIEMPDEYARWVSPVSLASRFGNDACFAVIGANGVADGFPNLTDLLLESFRHAPALRFLLIDQYAGRDRLASFANATCLSSEGTPTLAERLQQHGCRALLLTSLAPGAELPWVPVARSLGLPLLQVVSGARS